MIRIIKILSFLILITPLLFSSCKKDSGNTCNDGVKNGSETAIDCGGNCAPCQNIATCDDGIQNGNEVGIDCGGDCTPCSNVATCDDGIQNGDETGIDCGGSCNSCASCSDGIQNGNETGIDCGGDCDPCWECGVETVTDIDGNEYSTISIAGQCWLTENLKTSRYNDGVSIPNVSDAAQWSNGLNTGAYCIYNNEAVNEIAYGKLYNWYAVGTGKLCPEGWHVPSANEWENLVLSLGGENIAGGSLKSNSNLWSAPNEGANNNSGFSALPAGLRYDYSGEFFAIGEQAFFWSINNPSNNDIIGAFLSSDDAGAYIDIFLQKGSAASCRCVKD